MGIDRDFDIAFAKALLGAGMNLPQGGTAFVSVKDADKDNILPAVEKLVELGFSIIATGGTAAHLQSKGLPVETVNKVAQGRPHIVDKLLDGNVDLVFNTTEGWQSLKDSHSIRATALNRKVPYFTTAAASLAAARSIEAVRGHAAIDRFPVGIRNHNIRVPKGIRTVRTGPDRTREVLGGDHGLRGMPQPRQLQREANGRAS